MAPMFYSLVRFLVDLIATRHGNEAKLTAEVLALRRQVQVLERHIKRVRWEPGDRMILAALRERLPRSAWAALLVQPKTVLGWHRELIRRRWAAYRGRPRTGRPPIAEEVRELIVRMARENPRWGYFRIRGEFLKLGYTVSATTIRSVLRRHHVPPAGRRSQMTWAQFLSAHAESLVATDFFTVDTVFFKRLYVLLFMHLKTRRVLAAACTAQPTSAWVTQQARNLSWRLRDEGINVRVVVHDRDRKFARGFDNVFEAEGARVILTPLIAPKANAHAERWVGSARRECLDWMLIVSQRHLEAVLSEYCAHYNDERPHRSCGLRPPASRGEPIGRPGATIRRGARLGGLLNEYSRAPIAA
ncbi:MAG TPA: integrase core domain-containing protein [Candidatus Dormibacteraeota bacterium]|nr:integrase core domain-containing protein [Candidatus Dormibacteraeota bacterium]